jgi:hypothetical protein
MENFRTFRIISVGVLFFTQLAFAQDFYDLKSEVYSKIRDKNCIATGSLDQCVCPEAKAMKEYIEILYKVGVSKDEIFLKVAKEFPESVITDEQIRTKVEKKLVEESLSKRQ